MLSKATYTQAVQKTLEYFKQAGIILTETEKTNIEVADFGLGDLDNTGLQLITYVNTERCCAKELVLFPKQTCPEHVHPEIEGAPGKEETFRCRWGSVYLYVAGSPTDGIKAIIPEGKSETYTVFHEVILNPGEQYTLAPGTKHWFQGGPSGAVVSEFSTRSLDEADLFTDAAIVRTPEIKR